jgi:hypothetical protein
VPFDFLRRRKGQASEPGAAAPEETRAPIAEAAVATGDGIRFDGLTADWRLAGTMHVEGRLSDALNRRESIAISDVHWAPLDGLSAMVPAPGIKSIDPYDLIAVLAGPDTLAHFTEAERAAHRVRKEPYGVVLEAPPLRIQGTIHVFPGMEPQQMLDQVPEMFVPLTAAIAFYNDRQVADNNTEVVLVNRLYVREVQTS